VTSLPRPTPNIKKGEEKRGKKVPSLTPPNSGGVVSPIGNIKRSLGRKLASLENMGQGKERHKEVISQQSLGGS